MKLIRSWIRKIKYGFDIDARAEERRQVCSTCKCCTYNPTDHTYFCTRCGQKLDTIIYNLKICPVNSWQEVDEDYIN